MEKNTYLKPGVPSPFTRDLLCDPLWSQLSPLG